MGWFSDACSWVADKVSSGARAVGRAVSKGFSVAREKAAQACDWIAEKGEKFIDDVKETYQKIKPYLQKVRPWFNTVAAFVAPSFPWLAGALVISGKVLDNLLAFENSEVAQGLEKALKQTIKFAQVIKERYLTQKEVAQAQAHQKTFAQVAKIGLEAEQQKALAMATMFNNYALLKTQLRDVLEMGVSDFQHYLRLRATQKLLDEAEQKLTQSQTIEVVSDDDIFLVDTAQKMLADAELSTESAVRLSEITEARFGKPLIPFVFEELIMIWVQKQNELEKQWEEVSKELAQVKVQKTRLETTKKTSTLTQEETELYEKLLGKFTGLETKLKRVDKERRSMKSYVYAAEGFVQILEKDEQTLINEDKDYLIDDSNEIASIIIRVASNNVDWDTLTTEEQSLITDYANIFEQEGKARAESLAQELQMEITG